MNSKLVTHPWLWDIFCRVIDNHGDLGVCWRLSRQLALRGHHVRLWVDDATALGWMAPSGQPGVTVLPWPTAPTIPTGTQPKPIPTHSSALPTAQVWVETFGCNMPDFLIADNPINTCYTGQKSLKNKIWINLEYLTAEPYAERCHALPSPVMHGPGAGQVKRFFYPGFTPATGGLLREADLAQRQARFDRSAWLQSQGIDWQGERLVSLFCYEPPALAAWLAHWAADPQPTVLLVTPGRAQAAVRQVLGQGLEQGLTHSPLTGSETGQGTGLRIVELPHLSQIDFDHLLWACDINAVRGEDSLVRAMWAGKPLLWHIYPQDDGAHRPKLDAFLDWLDAPEDLRHWHHTWNPVPGGDGDGDGTCSVSPTTPLPAMNWARALACIQHARARLLAQPDLVTQLETMAQGLAEGLAR